MRKCLILLIFSLSSVLAQNWIIEPVDSTNFMFECSIAVDTLNYPHIAYSYRQRLGVNLYSYWVKYARWNEIAWEYQPVETTVTSGGFPSYINLKLCLDNQSHPHIVYYKDSVYQKLKYAYHDGNSWQISTITSSSDSLTLMTLSMTMSNDGISHISYAFIDYSDSTEGVRYGYKNGDSWIIQTVWQENRIPNDPGFNSAITLDMANYPVIIFGACYGPPIDSAYFYYARFNGQNWEIETIERNGLYEGYGVYSVKVDESNRVHIFYQRFFELFYAVGNADTWDIEFLRSNGLFEAAGDMVLEGNKPRVVVSSSESNLTYGYKNDSLWQYERIDPDYQGIHQSMAKDCENGIHVSYNRLFVSWYIYLCYARRNPPAIAEKKPYLNTAIPIEIYPNPAKGVIRIRCPLSMKGLKIFDVSGKLIKVEQVTSTQEHKQKIEIPLKGINPGIYFLQIGTELKKFLVVK